MPDMPRWFVELAFIILILWWFEKQIAKLKQWVESLVASTKKAGPEKSDEIVTDEPCIICGTPCNEDFAECPTCSRKWVSRRICGKHWNKVARAAVLK